MAPRTAYNFNALMLQRNLRNRNVSIRERIQDYRSKHPNKKPLVLVDLMHIDQLKLGLRDVIHRNICGPNLDQLRCIEDVFRFLRDECQAELVFFVDGPDPKDLHEEFLDCETSRKDDRYAKDIEIVDTLGSGANYKQNMQRFRHIPTDRILMDAMKSIAERYGVIWHAFKNNRTTEMAKYATERGALACLCKNSKILLLAGHLPQLLLWYVPELNCASMTVTELDLHHIKHGMRLTSKKKRLLMVTLLPGSIVGRHTLWENVHDTLAFVEGLPSNIAEPQYRSIVAELFQGTTTTWQQLQQACELYDLASIQLSEQLGAVLPSFKYDILNNRTSTITVMLNDYRYWALREVDFYQLVVRFYRRLAGAVLADNQGEPIERRIRIKPSHDTPFRYEMIQVEFPNGTVSFEADDYLERVAYVLDLDNIGRIRSLMEQDGDQWRLLDYVTVHFLVKKNMISASLADVLLLAIEIQSSGDHKQIGQFPHEMLNMEAFHATFMYVRWRYYVRTTLESCGVPAPLIDGTLRLDGGRLQVLYQRYLEELDSLDGIPVMRYVRQFGLHH